MFGTRKRTYKELQILILRALKKEKSTIYEVAKKRALHFHVAERQLILLEKLGYVALDFGYGRFRLFAITENGLKYLRKITR